MKNKKIAYSNGVFFDSMEKMLEYQKIYQRSPVSDLSFDIEFKKLFKDCRLNVYDDDDFTNNELQIILAECFITFIKVYREIFDAKHLKDV